MNTLQKILVGLVIVVLAIVALTFSLVISLLDAQHQAATPTPVQLDVEAECKAIGWEKGIYQDGVPMCGFLKHDLNGPEWIFVPLDAAQRLESMPPVPKRLNDDLVYPWSKVSG